MFAWKWAVVKMSAFQYKIPSSFQLSIIPKHCTFLMREAFSDLLKFDQLACCLSQSFDIIYMVLVEVMFLLCIADRFDDFVD